MCCFVVIRVLSCVQICPLIAQQHCTFCAKNKTPKSAAPFVLHAQHSPKITSRKVLTLNSPLFLFCWLSLASIGEGGGWGKRREKCRYLSPPTRRDPISNRAANHSQGGEEERENKKTRGNYNAYMERGCLFVHKKNKMELRTNFVVGYSTITSVPKCGGRTFLISLRQGYWGE
ncbi:hypothetical protein BDB00DRAFT_403096 [Zychaea mexicana]|uniref:uncharacterized protein n=1 Tax=Zychaea mexicana TaxID=64656 RepID=UPI0022FEA1B8|nr:uncharacterized protein BDB00DRAFT_403096 [Zychaea mexicana]KAI9498781.1 hypothetical protein BDB00DRAFT_403096 [Zychaea mexicana]